ncbi:MAG: class I SAM-dependent methyltransferase [Chloroflexota bacterium]
MSVEQPASSASGAAWGSDAAAAGWRNAAAARGQALAPVTEAMLHLAGVREGSRVLDVGAGTGDQTVEAAQRVGPNGSVLATDISSAMLEHAGEAIRAAGLSNVEWRVMDAQQLDLESGSFDAAIARFSLQFVPDVQRALGEIRRVLRPGGRFAAVVFSSVEKNLFRSEPQAIASRLLGRRFPEPGPGQWALNEPGILREAFERARFEEVDARTVPFVYRFPSLSEARQNLEGTQPLLVKLLGELNEEQREAAWAEIEQVLRPYEGPNGFEIDNEALVAVGARGRG